MTFLSISLVFILPGCHVHINHTRTSGFREYLLVLLHGTEGVSKFE